MPTRNCISPFCAAMAVVPCGLGLLLSSPSPAEANPANKAALERHYDKFLAKDLIRCTTCHLPSNNKSPESLDEFPHNPFGHRLRMLGKELRAQGKKADIPTRLKIVAQADSDADGVPNQIELLLGHNPGDAQDAPTKKEMAETTKRHAAFDNFLTSYRWQPFETVKRPPVPKVKFKSWVRNPIDAFVAAEHEGRKLKHRPEATKGILLRRVYLDLIGLSPTPEELTAFENDKSPNAYEKVVERLLIDSRYGERWGRHWMDVWRYSDWAGWSGGNQIRDSKPHIWRWRDWIVESLNENKGYDRMVLEMLAADELAPTSTNALRATGYLVRNYKMLSREQWLEDTIKHTSQAFLGLTMGCAKCHNHMYDPISQEEYYQMRAIFEPHQIRTDRIPGQTDTSKDGLVRVFDTDTHAPTYFFIRGDERKPDTNHLLSPDVPQALGGALNIEPVKLPRLAAFPDKREFVVQDAILASEKALADERVALDRIKTNSAARPEKINEQELNVTVAVDRHALLLATLRAEKLEDDDKKDSEQWNHAATEAASAQRRLAITEAKLKLHLAVVAQAEAQAKADGALKDLEAAKNKTSDAEKALAAAEKELQSDPTTAYKPRSAEIYPAASTGRRLAFARWVAHRDNPLTARVAMNHIWLRHFGRGIVPTPADFGRNGRPPSHPQLLDWLAAEFMAQNWSMKAMHRLIVTSSTYRMASTLEDANARIDPDNIYLWRMNSRRMEAEAVRDNLLYVSDDLDPAMGGPDIDHQLGLTSKRRSLYLRVAAEKEVEFLRIFDSPSVTECYERRPSVMPQQALALANSELTLRLAKRLAQALNAGAANDADKFITQAFLKILARHPNQEERRFCADFLKAQTERLSAQLSTLNSEPSTTPTERSRENLVLVLFNHNDLVTIR